MAVNIDITDNVKAVAKDLKGLKLDVNRASKNSINRTLRSTQSATKKFVHQWVGTRVQAQAAKLIKLWFASSSKTTGTLSVKGGTSSRPSVKHMKGARQLKSGHVKWKVGKRQWKVKGFEGGPGLGGHFFKNAPGGGITKLLGPSAADWFANNTRWVRNKISGLMTKHFDMEMNKQLKKKGWK